MLGSGTKAAAAAGHGLRTPDEEIAFTARPKIKSHSQIYRYRQSIFCLPHRPKISDFFDLCLHWVSVVRGQHNGKKSDVFSEVKSCIFGSENICSVQMSIL